MKGELWNVAASVVSKEDEAKAVSRVMIGVSAGIVIGIPVTIFIANMLSFKAAMLFFVLVNLVAFIATILFVPSMPVKEKLSYGKQLSESKKSVTWLSLFVVSSIGAALFAVYAYIAQYLQTITSLTGTGLSIALFLFGGASILGNFLAGKLLAKRAGKTVIAYPLVLGAVYFLLFVLGSFMEPMVAIVVVWGMLNGIGNNIQQYWIVSAIPEALDFANGLFIAFGNLGTTLGTAAGGMILAGWGVHYTIFGGLVFLGTTFVAVLLRKCLYGIQLDSEIEPEALVIDK